MTIVSPQPGDVVLRGHALPLSSDVGKAFVEDCARYTEGLTSETDVKSKWGISNEAWQDLEKNQAMLDALQRERARRVRNGAAATEAARQHFVKAPSILGGILSNAEVSPRHRIEAAKELRAITSAAGAAQQGGEKFTVVINLGAGEQRVYHLDGNPNLDPSRNDE
jgi:hypothetical protein